MAPPNQPSLQPGSQSTPRPQPTPPLATPTPPPSLFPCCESPASQLPPVQRSVCILPPKGITSTDMANSSDLPNPTVPTSDRMAGHSSLIICARSPPDCMLV